MPITISGTSGTTFPSWTTTSRPSSPSVGQTGFNSTTGLLETYNGTNWSSAGGAAGGGNDQLFYLNSLTMTTSYTIPSGKSAMATGPITINSGVVLTVPSGSKYVVL